MGAKTSINNQKVADEFGENKYKFLFSRWSEAKRRSSAKDRIERNLEFYDEWNNFYLFAIYVSKLSGCFNDILVLDRINNRKGYIPGNVRFATRTINSRNRDIRSCLLIDGISVGIAEIIESILKCKFDKRNPDHKRLYNFICTRRDEGIDTTIILDYVNKVEISKKSLSKRFFKYAVGVS